MIPAGASLSFVYISLEEYFCAPAAPLAPAFCPLDDALRFVPLAVVTGRAPPNSAADELPGERDEEPDVVRWLGGRWFMISFSR